MHDGYARPVEAITAWSGQWHAVMPIDVKTTTAKFIQLVAIEKVLLPTAINTITLEAK